MSVSATVDMQKQGQQDILNAAARCFMDRGYTMTSIDDVARSLGSTKGRIYHHYRSKADLFFDVFRTGMTMNFDAVMPIFEGSRPAADKFRRMAMAHCRAMILTQPFQRCVWEGVEMLMRGSTTPTQRATLEDLQAMRENYSEIFRTVLKQIEADGSIRIENSGIALQLMFMSLNSPLFWYSERNDQTPDTIDRIARQCTTFALRGLGLNEEVLANV